MKWPVSLRRARERISARFVLSRSPGGAAVRPESGGEPTPIRSEPSGTPPGAVLETTLLELVGVLCAVTRSDAEVVATVIELVRAGRVRLIGNFRGREAELAAALEPVAARQRTPA